MANFYYVKSGGTAATSTDDGRVATTRSTGSFATKGAANYWDSIVDALLATTVPVSGDLIMCSDLHAKVFTVGIDTDIPNGVTVISVADANLDQYAIGASEICDNGASSLSAVWNTAPQGEAALVGMNLSCENDINFRGTGGRFYLQDCSLNCESTTFSHSILVNTDGLHVILKNCDINLVNTSNSISCIPGTIEFDNLTSTGTKVNNLFDIIGSGGGKFIVRNTDLSQILATSGNLVTAPQVNDDFIYVYLENCKLPTSMNLFDSIFLYPHHKILLSGCGTADEYFHFEMIENYNVVKQDLVTFLNATYDGTTKFSTKISVHPQTYPTNPYRYSLGVIVAQDLTVAKTVTVELTSDAGLTDFDIWLEISRQDTTDQALGIVVDTKASADVLTTGTNLSTPADPGWTNPDTETYQITKDLGAIANVTNSNVEVWACMGKPFLVANFDQPTIADT